MLHGRLFVAVVACVVVGISCTPTIVNSPNLAACAATQPTQVSTLPGYCRGIAPGTSNGCCGNSYPTFPDVTTCTSACQAQVYSYYCYFTCVSTANRTAATCQSDAEALYNACRACPILATYPTFSSFATAAKLNLQSTCPTGSRFGNGAFASPATAAAVITSAAMVKTTSGALTIVDATFTITSTAPPITGTFGFRPPNAGAVDANVVRLNTQDFLQTQSGIWTVTKRLTLNGRAPYGQWRAILSITTTHSVVSNSVATALADSFTYDFVAAAHGAAGAHDIELGCTPGAASATSCTGVDVFVPYKTATTTNPPTATYGVVTCNNGFSTATPTVRCTLAGADSNSVAIGTLNSGNAAATAASVIVTGLTAAITTITLGTNVKLDLRAATLTATALASGTGASVVADTSSSFTAAGTIGTGTTGINTVTAPVTVANGQTLNVAGDSVTFSGAGGLTVQGTVAGAAQMVFAATTSSTVVLNVNNNGLVNNQQATTRPGVVLTKGRAQVVGSGPLTIATATGNTGTRGIVTDVGATSATAAQLVGLASEKFDTMAASSPSLYQSSLSCCGNQCGRTVSINANAAMFVGPIGTQTTCVATSSNPATAQASGIVNRLFLQSGGRLVFNGLTTTSAPLFVETAFQSSATSNIEVDLSGSLPGTAFGIYLMFFQGSCANVQNNIIISPGNSLGGRVPSINCIQALNGRAVNPNAAVAGNLATIPVISNPSTTIFPQNTPAQATDPWEVITAAGSTWRALYLAVPAPETSTPTTAALAASRVYPFTSFNQYEIIFGKSASAFPISTFISTAQSNLPCGSRDGLDICNSDSLSFSSYSGNPVTAVFRCRSRVGQGDADALCQRIIDASNANTNLRRALDVQSTRIIAPDPDADDDDSNTAFYSFFLLFILLICCCFIGYLLFRNKRRKADNQYTQDTATFSNVASSPMPINYAPYPVPPAPVMVGPPMVGPPIVGPASFGGPAPYYP